MIKGHGGNLAELASKHNLRVEQIVDFSASVHCCVPKRDMARWIADGAKRVDCYPDPEYKELRASLASIFGISSGSIIAGNGSTELLYMALRAYRPRHALLLSPSYSDYADAALNAGAKLDKLSRSEQHGFLPDIALVERLAERASLVIIGNPNNPTGALIEKRDMLRMINRCRNSMFIVDEAFMDFAPEDTLLGNLKPNLLVLRSLTKFYGIAGLRLGFVAGAKSALKPLEKLREPWTVNCIAEQVGIQLAKNGPDRLKVAAKVAKERQLLFEQLLLIDGVTPHPSRGNFLLCKLGKLTARQLQSRLIKHKIAIRDCTNFDNLGNRWFRVAVRSRSDNLLLASSIRTALQR